ncbi:putative glycine-rich RNA-binding protein [Hibiscus syriacus]|uniref:Glycine-rich RNA-binding protein n=1 Tax=Hibiscus syriacus TaxID=106335 RepID=A0A6A2YVX4_HIBSY|nr:putative glycine-rich RNA-binding protein [Hibiscus syriacus]
MKLKKVPIKDIGTFCDWRITPLLRNIARMLTDEHIKRVFIVNTSNEIGGDGDVPHEEIGRARRMKVPNVNLQHNVNIDVMIEVVANHVLETIIIDKIDSKLEALATSTIAQRVVQLVGTAHGMTIHNIIKNHSLQTFVCAIESFFIGKQSETLGDEEARKRKVQKTILERKGLSTFTCAVKMISKTEYHVHHRLDATVDSILASSVPITSIVMAKIDHCELSHMLLDEGKKLMKFIMMRKMNNLPCLLMKKNVLMLILVIKMKMIFLVLERNTCLPGLLANEAHQYLFILRRRSTRFMFMLKDEIDVTDDIEMADAILATASEIKQNPWIRGIAKFHWLPMFVIKELRLDIEYIVIPGGECVELLPRCFEIIAHTLKLVKSYQLDAENSGTELNTRLQVLPHRLNRKFSSKSLKTKSNL